MDSKIVDVVSKSKINQDVSMHCSRANTEFKTSIHPETSLTIYKTTSMKSGPIQPSHPLGYLGVRKPTAGEVDDSRLSNLQIQIQKGMNFFLEDLLPPHQKAPPISEGKHSNSNAKKTYNKFSIKYSKTIV
jgi:hypothetical protein